MAAILHFRLTLGSLTGSLCLTGSLIGTCSFGSILLRSLTGQTLCLGFSFTGFSYPTGILAGSSLGGSLLTGQFFFTFLLGSSLGGSFLAGFFGSTSTRLGHFFGYQLVNLGIECLVFLTLIVNDALNGLLLFLKCIYHLLLFVLLALQRSLFFLTFI